MNTPARALSSPLYRQRVVPAKRYEPDAQEQLADMERCPWCASEMVPVHTHGHEQCSQCGQVTVDCCSGETA